jgi:hypothetical protein
MLIFPFKEKTIRNLDRLFYYLESTNINKNLKIIQNRFQKYIRKTPRSYILNDLLLFL